MSYTCPVIETGNSVYLKVQGLTPIESKGSVESKALSIADTLIATKTGYSNKKTPINSYNLSGISINMDSLETCNATTLKEAGACRSYHKMLIGVAISPGKLTDPNAAREFNYVTPENEMAEHRSHRGCV